MFLVVSLLFLRETYAPVLLERKAARLRKETGNPALRSKLHIDITIAEKMTQAIAKPMQLLFTAPIVTMMSLYLAVAYAILYLLISTFTEVYEEQYHFSQGDVGLTFVPSGVGMMIGVSIFGTLTDRIIKNRQRKGLELKPEHRLNPFMTIPCGVVMPLGLFIYGWGTDKGVHWIVPMIGTAILSAGLVGIMVSRHTF